MKGEDQSRPPRLANWLLTTICKEELLEAIQGDLFEFYQLRLESGVSRFRADVMFFLGVLSALRPAIIQKRKSSNTNLQIMLSIFFKIALRTLRKNLAYTLINVAGLALGIACCLIIFVMVRFETSFDDYHCKSDRIYRVNLKDESPNAGRRLNGCNFTPLAAEVRNEVSGIEATTGVCCVKGYSFKVDQQVYEQAFAFFVDPSYFDVFDVEWLVGEPGTALSSLHTAVITDDFAQQYFGGVSQALGRSFQFANKLSLTVSGVVQKPPKNTDHPFSLLISFASLPDFYPEADHWEHISQGATYIVLHPEAEKAQIYPQLEAIAAKHLAPQRASEIGFFLMPLKDNHDRNGDFNSFNYDFPLPVLMLLSTIAGMIAFIACINFINLSTAQSFHRSREVGVRKTLGSTRTQLIVQYLTETLVITLIASGLGLALAKAGMVFLNTHYTGTELAFDFLTQPSIFVFLVGLLLTITVLAGFYPAFVLSRFTPTWALKANRKTGKARGLSLRRLLVVAQFLGAQVLILVMLIILNQINTFKSRDLGFDPEAIVQVNLPFGTEEGAYQKISRQISQIPGVRQHTLSTSHLTGGEGMVFHAEADELQINPGRIIYADEQYLATYDIALTAGRNLAENFDSQTHEVLVNETLIEKLGIGNPEAAIGSFFVLNDQRLTIRGVMEDFYTHPMSNRIDPVALKYDQEKPLALNLKIDTDQIPATLSKVEAVWRRIYPDHFFKYRFMDDAIERQYGFFTTISTFLGTASFLAIFIGCLGLYGLVSFMAVQRNKEIGIRKVFGATIANIMSLFAKESVLLILLAFLMAAPVAYFGGRLLLSELPDQTDPGYGVFALTLVMSLIIGCSSVGFQVFKASSANPSVCLKDE